MTAVTVVTQTQVQPDREAAFTTWQTRISDVVGRAPGFVRQTVVPPSPPSQVDWVILQRFESREAALGWLHSKDRQRLLGEAQTMLVGIDDVHLVTDAAEEGPRPTSVVISTRVKPGREADYRRWEQKIAATQARARGFRGYRFEEPVPGVQEDWLAVLQFDTEQNLQAWLDSPERAKLVAESADLTVEFHTRVAKTGFDQWFQMGGAADAPPPAAWKQNMVVLMLLYPVVFLFGVVVGAPVLDRWLDVPFWAALFIGNIASVWILSWLVPPVSRLFSWWLRPGDAGTSLKGAAVVAAVYAVCLAVFSQM